MSADTSDRRAVVTGVLMAVLLALGAGSAVGLLATDRDPAAEPAGEEPTERTVASLPAPEDEPRPVEAYFPSIDGLDWAEADDRLVSGLEDHLRPVDGEYDVTRHRQLRRDDEPVALISLLRVADEGEAEGLRRNALNGLGTLFDRVDDAEVADEQIIRAESRDGTVLLWLPDTGSVLVVSALDGDRAEGVLTEVVGSVRGDVDNDGSAEREPQAALFRQ